MFEEIQALTMVSKLKDSILKKRHTEPYKSTTLETEEEGNKNLMTDLKLILAFLSKDNDHLIFET